MTFQSCFWSLVHNQWQKKRTSKKQKIHWKKKKAKDSFLPIISYIISKRFCMWISCFLISSVFILFEKLYNLQSKQKGRNLMDFIFLLYIYNFRRDWPQSDMEVGTTNQFSLSLIGEGGREKWGSEIRKTLHSCWRQTHRN